MGQAKERGTRDDRIAQAKAGAEEAMGRMVGNLAIVEQRKNLNTAVVRYLIKETYPDFIFPDGK